MAKLSVIAAVALHALGCLSASVLLDYYADGGEVGEFPAVALNAVQPKYQPDAIPSAATFEKFKTAKVGDKFVEGNTVFTYKGLSKEGSNSKRQDCSTATYQATQVPQGQTGTWWTSWTTATGCFEQGKSSGSPSNCQDLSLSSSTSWTYSSGFSTGSAGDVLHIINSNFNFNFGYTWGQSNTNTQTFTCCPGSQPVSQIWQQNEMGWSNSQVQTCYYSSCTGELYNCGAWSAYQHANWSLQDNNSTAFGCSTGSNNCDCNNS